MIRRFIAMGLVISCVACSPGAAGPSPTPSTDAPGTPSASVIPTATVAALPNGVQASIKTGTSPEAALDAFGSIWVSNHRPGTLTRIDPADDSVVTTVDLGGGHIDPPYEAAGKLWATSADAATIVAIDPATNQPVASIDCGCEGGGFTWVAGVLWFAADDALWQIDPTEHKVTKRSKGFRAIQSVVSEDRWFGIDDARALYEFDPKTGKTIGTTKLDGIVGSGAIVATVTGSTIWFSTHDGTLSSYDVKTARGSQLARLDLGQLDDPEAPVLIAATDDAIYLRPRPEVIVHVDPRTGTVVDRFEGMPPGQYHSYFTAAFGSLWVPHFSKASVWRISLEAV